MSKSRTIASNLGTTSGAADGGLDSAQVLAIVPGGFDSADVLTISAPLSNRNLIINGAMAVSQRGTSISAASDSTYTADRFRTRNYGGNGTYTVSTLQTDVPSEGGFKYSTKFAVNSAATDTGTYAYGVEQSIEGYNIAQLRLGRSDAKQFTLSFWVKSSLSGTYTSAVRTSTAEYSYVFEFSLTANTWTKITKTIPALTSTLSSLDETNGAGLLVSPINLGAQTSKSTATTNTWLSGNYVFTSNQVDWMGTAGATCHLTGVQLEIGNTATSFEHKPYVQDMTECLRYFNRYRKTNSYGEFVTLRTYSATQGTGLHQFPTPMRAAPTLTIDKTVNSTYFAYNLNAISITGTDGNFTGSGFHATSASNSFVTGGGAVIQSNGVQDISFNLDAEL